MTVATTTEAKVSGSSFYTAMRVLPPRERTAMFAIYDFCRKVDDIADDPGPTREERRVALDRWRADLDALYAGDAPESCRGLIGPVRDYGLERADFLAVVDGMQMDVDTDIRAPDFAILDLYCDRVASAVGRLSVKVFGMDEGPGKELAHHLGRALQFTNILRDLDEDAGMGRLYLPAEALAAAGIPVAEASDPKAVMTHPGLDGACRWLAAKAHEQYALTDRIMARRPRGRMRTPALMIAVYGRILKAMEAEGWNAPRRRVSLGKAHLLWVALTAGLLG
ncbi:MAG TPA: presqualene diphosphate synthase HpnD [Caulobacteraceae bacterium]|nr:presqualene diphosphate synthase HpnD [Caulobacteraceae bacterium]